MEWLLNPVDPARVHDVGVALAWHGRLMVLAWLFLAPCAVLLARFAKIWHRQDWPRELDNPTWWHSHWIGQTAALLLTMVAFALVWAPTPESAVGAYHRYTGYALLVFLAFQVINGVARGSKGGPTATAADGTLRGDHFDMTPRRRLFERVHKSVGYVALAVSVLAVFTGLWDANAPRWMFAATGVWWAMLVTAFVWLQRRGLAVDTYQAIWGGNRALPGNQVTPIGWGVRRLKNN